ncbi:MAG TPA: DNA alkylation repair protein [Tepidisphaeraceae bacterium]|jgi:3-methyladenine DNA glycosylase AlkD|nr:DNA alkylation repair protein [Tepidisphaeraceae bacterium]
MTPSRPLINSLRKQLKAAANPAKAPAMQAYMKSAMPYLGVSSVPLRAICKTTFTDFPLTTFDEFRDTLLILWRDAKFREERYAAIEFSGHKSYEQFQIVRLVPIYQEMITTGAWWDYVDPIAAHRLGPLLGRFPNAMSRKMRAWSKSKNLWLRRSAILCQLAFKKDTDLQLLYDSIEPAIAEKEFFLRKAIGWALRQYAWSDSGEIIRYVKENKSRLSPLSIREALKNCQRKPTRPPRKLRA